MLADETLSDELMAGLGDRSLFRGFSYVGGRWIGARDGATIR